MGFQRAATQLQYAISAARSSRRYYSYTSKSRTDVTAGLWKQRKPVTGDQPHMIVPKTVSESRRVVSYPFADDKELAEEYRNWRGNIRIGKLLEDLDSFAGNVAHFHADDGRSHTRPLTIVTACADRITALSRVPVDENLKLSGCVSWVGRSSMEITIELLRESNDSRLMESTFLMVARDPSTGSAAEVNPLKPESEDEERMFQEGEEAKIRRKQDAIATKELETRRQNKTLQGYDEKLRASAPAGRVEIPMSKTSCETVMICQPQEKNTNGKIFGGYIMRKAFELALANAMVFTNAATKGAVDPVFLAVDDISFVLPVDVGSLIRFQSEVVYSTDTAMQIRVVNCIHDVATNEERVANVCHFTFGAPCTVPHVTAHSDDELVRWLDGKRRLGNARSAAIHEKSSEDLVKIFGTDSS